MHLPVISSPFDMEMVKFEILVSFQSWCSVQYLQHLNVILSSHSQYGCAYQNLTAFCLTLRSDWQLSHLVSNCNPVACQFKFHKQSFTRCKRHRSRSKWRSSSSLSDHRGPLNRVKNGWYIMSRESNLICNRHVFLVSILNYRRNK